MKDVDILYVGLGKAQWASTDCVCGSDPLPLPVMGGAEEKKNLSKIQILNDGVLECNCTLHECMVYHLK